MSGQVKLVLGGALENPDVIPFESALSRCWGSEPMQYIVPEVHQSPHPKRHRFSRFYKAHVVADRQIDTAHNSVCGNRPHLASAAVQPNKGKP